MKPEKIEENKFVRLCRVVGYIPIKQQTKGPYGTRGYSDQFVLAAYGTTVLFEFKRVGEKPTEIQKYRHKHFKRLGHKTYVVTDAEAAFKALEAEVKKNKKLKLQAKRLSKAMHKIRCRKT